MEIYILRHGEAEPRELGKDDEERALIARGKRQVKAMVRHTRGIMEADLILSSPLRRAKETAEIARSALDCPLRYTEELKPDAAPAALWKELSKEAVDRIVVVGHQPYLGQLIAFLLGASIDIDLKKGAIVRIDCEKRRGSPKGTLKWFLIPRLV